MVCGDRAASSNSEVTAPVFSQPAARGGPPDSGQFVDLDGPARPGASRMRPQTGEMSVYRPIATSRSRYFALQLFHL